MAKEYIRCTLFKWYFNNYKNETEENCKIFFKEKSNKSFKINDDINKLNVKIQLIIQKIIFYQLYQS